MSRSGCLRPRRRFPRGTRTVHSPCCSVLLGRQERIWRRSVPIDRRLDPCCTPPRPAAVGCSQTVHGRSRSLSKTQTLDLYCGHDSFSIRPSFDCPWTAVRLPFDGNWTALRPFDDLRYDRKLTPAAAQVSVNESSRLHHCDLNYLRQAVERPSNAGRIEVEYRSVITAL